MWRLLLMVVRELVMPWFDNVLSGCTYTKRTLRLAEQLESKGMLKSVRVVDMTVEDGKKADDDASWKQSSRQSCDSMG